MTKCDKNGQPITTKQAITPKSELWDRLADEPINWFYRFDRHYRALGPERRIEQAWRNWKTENAAESNGKRPPKQWYQNAKRWKWNERAGSWDASIRRERHQAETTAVKEMLDRHVEVSVALLEKAAEWIQNHRIENASDAIRAFRVAVELERKSRSLPDYLLEIQNMTDEELIEKYKHLAAAIGSDGAGNALAGFESAGAGDGQP